MRNKDYHLYLTDTEYSRIVSALINLKNEADKRLHFAVASCKLSDGLLVKLEEYMKEYNMNGDMEDTKYKMIERFEESSDIRRSLTDNVSQSDLYQIVTYAVKRDLSDVYLLYPMFRYESEEPDMPIMKVEHMVESQKKPINVHIARVPFIFEEDSEKTQMELRTAIEKIFA